MAISELKNIISSTDIKSLNCELTKLMTEKNIWSAIKGDKLGEVIDAVLALNNTDDPLLSAAVLGRLAAVARGRDDEVFANIPALFGEEPQSIETLADGDEKFYASVALRYSDVDWLTEYCFQEAISTDTAEKARKELFKTALNNSGDVSKFLVKICDYIEPVKSISNIDARAKRIRRIFTSLVDVVSEWDGEWGSMPGDSLDKCFNCLMKGQYKEVEEQMLFSIVDPVLTILQRIIAFRFSHAFDSNTYKVIESCKRVLGNRHWSNYLSESSIIKGIRILLLEAAVVLAKQGRTDVEFINLLAVVYGGKNKIGLAARNHFKEHKDLDPEVRDWWVKAGDLKETRRQAEHKIGGSVDQQIGALMIEVEIIKEAMDKLERAIIPFLEMHDPVLASTVKKASTGYASISRISRQLGRMRKLVTTKYKGERMEYNPQQHEMLGGHKPGVRKVKIVRDGVEKDFAGKVKTLVKCWVEPQE